jgi:ATP-dependent protease Clp ATPase subunit
LLRQSPGYLHVDKFLNITNIVLEAAVFNSSEFDTFIATSSAAFYHHLENVSISLWSASKLCSHFNVRKIRDFLSPQDSVVKKILANQLYTDSRRAEFTCEWFAGPLRKFTRNGKKVMLISGPACSGKTVLARYVHEKLNEAVEDDPFDIIAYSVGKFIHRSKVS